VASWQGVILDPCPSTKTMRAMWCGCGGVGKAKRPLPQTAPPQWLPHMD